MEVVQEMFPERVFSTARLPWPARSPDLSACDYFLWGYRKAKVYTIRSRAIVDLKIAIRKQISAIPVNMARRALGNCERGWNDGQQLSDVLLKTKSTET
jgi:hypothetical protein